MPMKGRDKNGGEDGELKIFLPGQIFPSMVLPEKMLLTTLPV